MKKELTPTTTKGELLQPNFKTLHVGLDSPEDGERWQIINQDGEHILYIESYPLRENAIAICQAVNERQKLLDSNRELLDALKEWQDYYKHMGGENHVASRPIREKTETILNRIAKTTQP